MHRILPAGVWLSVRCLPHDAGRNKKDDPSQIGNRDVGKGINFYSSKRRWRWASSWRRKSRRQAKIVDDPLISEYVNRVGQNLVRNSDAKVPFTFRVIEGDAPNAFALPGGYVFVYTGADQDCRSKRTNSRRRWRTRSRTWRRAT